MTTPLHAQQSSEDARSSKTLRIIAFSAIFLAAAPHLFLQFPHALLLAGQDRAWIGLSIWAPLALAATALLTDTSLQGRFDHSNSISPAVRTAASVLVPLGVIAVLVQLHFQPPFLGRPIGWEKSVLMAMGMYGVIQALESIFWQGLIQHRILQNSSPIIRIVLVTALGLALWLPFTVSTGFAVAMKTYLLDFGLIALAGATLFELGLKTRSVMLARVLMGIGYAWAYHNLFF